MSLYDPLQYARVCLLNPQGKRMRDSLLRGTRHAPFFVMRFRGGPARRPAAHFPGSRSHDSGAMAGYSGRHRHHRRGADGPMALFVTMKLAPHLMPQISVAAYSYMAMMPFIQPPIMRLLTTKKERAIKMETPRMVTRLEKIAFTIIMASSSIFFFRPLLAYHNADVGRSVASVPDCGSTGQDGRKRYHEFLQRRQGEPANRVGRNRFRAHSRPRFAYVGGQVN